MLVRRLWVSIINDEILWASSFLSCHVMSCHAMSNPVRSAHFGYRPPKPMQSDRCEERKKGDGTEKSDRR